MSAPKARVVEWDRDVPQVLQEHILEMIKDPGLRCSYYEWEGGIGVVRERERCIVELQAIWKLRCVNKQFRDWLKWSVNTKLEDEISPKVSSCMVQLMAGAHVISQNMDEAERAKDIDGVCMYHPYQKALYELYQDLGPWTPASIAASNPLRTATVRTAFKRNVNYQWEHLKTNVAKVVFCQLLLRFFGKDDVLHRWLREKQEYYERPPESEA